MVSLMSGAGGLRCGLSVRPGTAPDPAALARLRLRLALPAALIRPGETTATVAPWRLSAGTALAPGGTDADLTAKYPAGDGSHVAFMGGGAKTVTILEPARQFPCATLAAGSGGNLQDGTSAALWTAAFRTDSPRIALRVDGGYAILSRLRVFVDGRRVTLPEPAAIGGGRRWLVLEPGPGLHAIQVQGIGDTAWGGFAVLPGSAVTAAAANARALVLGDSLTVGGGSGQPQWEAWPAQLAEALGIDDIWLSGSGGTGYLNGAGGAMTLPQRAAQDTARFAAAGPADLVVLAAGLNDLAQGDVTAAVTATLAAVRAAAPGALVAVLTPCDTAAPDAPSAAFAARRAEIIAACLRAGPGPGTGVVDLQGLAYARSDGSHATAAGAAAIAAHVAPRLLAMLRS